MCLSINIRSINVKSIKYIYHSIILLLYILSWSDYVKPVGFVSRQVRYHHSASIPGYTRCWSAKEIAKGLVESVAVAIQMGNAMIVQQGLIRSTPSVSRRAFWSHARTHTHVLCLCLPIFVPVILVYSGLCVSCVCILCCDCVALYNVVITHMYIFLT